MKIANASRSAAADGVVDLIDAGAAAGVIKVYDGTQPATPDTAVSGQTLLVTLTCSDPAVGAASNGVASFNAITAGTAVATGTASWARIEDSDGNVVADATVGTSGADINLDTTSIVSGGEVGVTSLTYTAPE